MMDCYAKKVVGGRIGIADCSKLESFMLVLDKYPILIKLLRILRHINIDFS